MFNTFSPPNQYQKPTTPPWFNDFFGNISNKRVDADSLYKCDVKTSDSSGPSEDDVDWKCRYNELLEDFNSFKRRTERQKLDDKNNMVKDVLKEYLDVIDYIDQIYLTKKALGSNTKEDDMLHSYTTRFLKKFGVSKMEISPLVTEFDVNLHEAMSTVRTSNTSIIGRIFSVLVDGYMFNNDVLRHAKVSVLN